jgi:hypothetical protein
MILGAAFGMSTSPYTPGAVRNYLIDYAQLSRLPNSSTPFCSELDVMKRDRFELLSAYLDGEVTPEERTLVQNWLSNDPTAKCLYNRLVALRRGLREEVCVSPCETDETLAAVFQCLNHRFRMVSMASAGVVIVGVLNLLSGGVGSSHAPWQVAQYSNADTLQIALDQPAFPIPELSALPVDSMMLIDPSGLPVESEL